MRRRRTAAARIGQARSLNVTPMIDVVMCLIVFYLIVGRLVHDRQDPIDLPDVEHGITDRPECPVVINVGADGSILMDRQPMTGLQLTQALRDHLASRPGTPVQVRGDRSLPFAAVEPVLAACRDVGVRSVRLAGEGGP